MWLVKTKVQPSKIHGLGLFADEFIVKGKIIWRFKKGIDSAWVKKEFKRLPKIVKDFIKRYGYASSDTGRYVLGFDNDCFVNHSLNPNTKPSKQIMDDGERAMVAVKNIKRGEEITHDYREIEKSNLKLSSH